MGAFPLLDLILGLAFVYLLLALICTTLMEWIAQLTNMRGKLLEQGTRRVLGEEAGGAETPLTKTYFEHALIRSLHDGKRPPSYVHGSVFARTLRDILSKRRTKDGAALVVSPKLQESLDALWLSEQEGTAADARPEDAPKLPSEAAIAEWYDQSMERVSGNYKRQSRFIILFLALFVTIAMNANTLTLTANLWRSPALRAALLERAKVRLAEGPPLETVEYTDPDNPEPTAPAAADSSRTPNRLLDDEQDLLGQLFTWSNERAEMRRLQEKWGAGVPGIAVWSLLSIMGWAITALAVSLGAPFWFDTLNRFMQLRATGAPPKSTQPKKEDKP